MAQLLLDALCDLVATHRLGRLQRTSALLAVSLVVL